MCYKYNKLEEHLERVNTACSSQDRFEAVMRIDLRIIIIGGLKKVGTFNSFN